MRDDSGFSAVPLPPPPGGTAESRARLGGLAGKRQMLIVAAILNGITGILLRVGGLPKTGLLLVSLGIGVFLIVAAVRIAYQLYNVGAAIGSAIAMLVPIVWIVVVIFLVVKSTQRLKAAADANALAGPPGRF